VKTLWVYYLIIKFYKLFLDIFEYVLVGQMSNPEFPLLLTDKSFTIVINLNYVMRNGI